MRREKRVVVSISLAVLRPGQLSRRCFPTAYTEAFATVWSRLGAAPLGRGAARPELLASALRHLNDDYYYPS